MTVRIYRSTDGSAPSLTNGASSLQDVLNTILVDGYGSQPAAGWTQPFSGSNKRVFQQGVGPTGTLQYLLRLAWNGAQVQPIGYETMSDVDTGTNAFSINTRLTCNTASPHVWYCAADARTFYFFYEDTTGAGYYQTLFFGDFYAYGAADIYRCHLGPTNSSSGQHSLHASFITQSVSSSFCGPLARSSDGSKVSCASRVCGDSAKSNVTGGNGGLGVIPFPNPAGNQIWLAPLYIGESITPPADNGCVNVRGKIRGLWHWLHPVSAVADRDTFNGTGDLAGKTFEILKRSQPESPGFFTDGVFIVETSNTWLTNL